MNKDQWDIQKYKEHILKKVLIWMYLSTFFKYIFMINLVTFSSLDYIA